MSKILNIKSWGLCASGGPRHRPHRLMAQWARGTYGGGLQLPRSGITAMCPRIRLPGHVVAAGRPVRRSPVIDGGDNRSIHTSKLVSRHGGQCLPLLGSRLCRISNATVLWCRSPRAGYGMDWKKFLENSGLVLKVSHHCNFWTDQDGFLELFPGFYPGVKHGTKTP